MDNILNIGEIVRFLRDRKKYTLRDLAEKIDLSFSQLSKIERGDNNPTRDTVRKLAKCLDFDVDSLMILCGYAPDGMQQEFMEQWQRHYERAMMATFIGSTEEPEYNFNLNSRKLINKYLDTTIQVQTVTSNVFNKLMDRFNSINDEEENAKALGWSSFIEDMVKQGITPDNITQKLKERDQSIVLMQELHEAMKETNERMREVLEPNNSHKMK